MEKQETVYDIIAECRGYAHGMPLCGRVTMTYKTFLDILSRIEKANKREMEAVGNTAKLREVCELLLRFDASNQAAVVECQRMVKAALPEMLEGAR